MKSHRDIEKNGFFQDGFGEFARACWPGWLQGHARSCMTCQDSIRAEVRLSRVGAHLRHAPRHAPPPPTVDELRRRNRPSRKAPIDIVASELQPFSLNTCRASPLELARTTDGIRATHPEASHVALFSAFAGRRPTLIAQASFPDRGVEFETPLEVLEEGMVIALATREPLDPDFWEVWLHDQIANETDPVSIPEDPRNRVHFAQLRVAPTLRPDQIKVRVEPLAPPRPEVTQILVKAAQAGRCDQIDKALCIYRQARDRARALGDATGHLKATCGIAMSLQTHGYPDDAERVLKEILDSATFDVTWGSWVCRFMARSVAQRGAWEEAQGWIEKSRAIEGSDSSVLTQLEIELALAADDTNRASSLLDHLTAAPSAMADPALEMDHTRILARRGDLTEACARFKAWMGPPSMYLEWSLRRALAWASLVEANALPARWIDLLFELRDAIAKVDGGVLPGHDTALLAQLAQSALKAGAREVATMIFRWRFLDTLSAADPRLSLLAAHVCPGGLLLQDPALGGGLRRHDLGAVEFGRLVARSRQQVLVGWTSDALQDLGRLLFPSGSVPERFLAASDGLLLGAPILAVAHAVQGPERPLPATRELTSLRRLTIETGGPLTDSIVSIADVGGDLSWARNEVREDEADRWLRGREATRASLRLEEPVGLLHLGIHSRREQGMPELMLADGPLSVAEIGGFPLQGRPVVLLAACASGEQTLHRGVERSFAQAFLGAGASAVIATRWPVMDREMSRFVRKIVEAWPFEDVAGTVATACDQLRQEGESPRLWAAPVVY